MVEIMIWYVAVIAIVNLGLGYVLGTMLGGERGRIAFAKRHAAEADDPIY